MPRRWSVAAWAAAQSPLSLLAVRLLVVANALVLAAIGGLCLAFAAHPAGVVGAALSWAAVAALLRLLPYTNPRRRDGGRW